MRLGLAISGGGHRAAVFGLGVLLYLADVQANRDVVSISSVSGGSIANAHAGLAGYRTAGRDEFREAAGRLAAQIANRGTLFAWRGTWLFLGVLILALAAAVAIWWLPLWWVWRLVLFAVAFAAWEVLLVRRRGEVCGRAYRATVLQGAATGRLTDLGGGDVDHVLCATHLHAGEHFYLAGEFVYSFRFGWGSPADLPLHVAVQASTALPGAFPPRWIRTRRFGLAGGPAPVPALVALVDGGVYDNMAEQWLTGLDSRRNVPAGVRRPDTLIVANASASMGMLPVRQIHWPLLGELFAFTRDSSIMYDNSASIRKRDLVDRFDAIAAAPDRPGLGLPGCLLDIRSDPFAAARAFQRADDSWPERAARARAVLARRPADWEGDGEFVSSVKTTLSKLGVETSARVLHHAYTLAAMNLHLFLGMPLVDVPSRDEFVRLCRGA